MTEFEYVTLNKEDIFDFDHPVLDELKRFLNLFNEHHFGEKVERNGFSHKKGNISSGNGVLK